LVADFERAFGLPIGGMQHEAALRLDRAAVVHIAIGRGPTRNIQIIEQRKECDAIEDIAKANAQRAFLVVDA